MMNKVIRNAKIAVLVSPGFGAGWYSWNPSHPECLFDPDVIAWVENGKNGEVPDLQVKYGWDRFYDGGAEDLMIEWVPVGEKFRIKEYDGSECIVFEKEERWIVA